MPASRAKVTPTDLPVAELPPAEVMDDSNRLRVTLDLSGNASADSSLVEPCGECFPHGWHPEATSHGCIHGMWQRVLPDSSLLPPLAL